MVDNALVRAARSGDLAEILKLVEQGERENIDYALVVSAGEGHLKVVRYLTGEFGLNADKQHAVGRTALGSAAHAGKLDVVRYLVEKCGTKVETKDDFGQAPLMWAAQAGEIEVVRYLAGEWGADINAKTFTGHSVLMWAVSCGKVEFVRYLVERKCHVNTKNNGGRTALMLAVERNETEIARYFAEQPGVDVNLVDNRGRTAFRIAADHGFPEIQSMLTRFMSLPDPQQRRSGTENNAVSDVQASDRPTSCFFPASEIEFLDFCDNSDFGGEYRAKWLDSDAVVKLFISDASKSAVFEEEVRLWKRLRHPNVIKMYGACDAGQYVKFFVCEYASKGSLSEYIKSTSSEKTFEVSLRGGIGFGVSSRTGPVSRCPSV